MKFLGIKAGAHQGRWFRCMTSEDGSEHVDFKIRPVPASEERRQNYQKFGRKQTVEMKGRNRLVDVDAQIGLLVEKACYALLDSRNADVDVQDDDQAAALTEALGKTVAKGETVRLDGKWTDEVKTAVLSHPEALVLARWVNERADSMTLQPTEEEDVKEEAALGKT